MPLTVNSIRAHLMRLACRPKVKLGQRPVFEKGAVLKGAPSGRIDIGQGFRLSTGAILDAQDGSIMIGDACSVNPYCILYGTGGLVIGNDVRIAGNTIIVPSNHTYEDPDTLIRKQPIKLVGITIGNDVWIGAHCTILAGAEIADGCVIAAGAVVRGATMPYGVYAGVPAKLIKYRKIP